MLGIPGNATIAASMAGTAAATVISNSISATYAKALEIFNLTGRNLEVGFGPDNGTADYTLTTPGSTPVMVVGDGIVFCPGTAGVTGVNVGRGIRLPIKLDAGMKIWVRTTENTPITCASTTALIINLWA